MLRSGTLSPPSSSWVGPPGGGLTPRTHIPLPRSGSSDPYCVVKVDNEVVARYGGHRATPGRGRAGTGALPGGAATSPITGRTATVWKSLNPFWGEEYTLRLPCGFRSLAVYVLDEDTIG